MKKLVIKTSLITLACIVGAMLIAFGVTALFAPVKMADFFDGVGNYSASVFFYEKQYKKTQEISDLELLVSKMDRQDAYEKGYLKELVEHEDFYSYTDGKGHLITTAEYYYGEYSLALFENGKFEDSLAVAKSYVDKYGYTTYNPLSAVIDQVLPNANVGQIDGLISVLQTVENGKTGEELNRIQKDLQRLNDAKNS